MLRFFSAVRLRRVLAGLCLLAIFLPPLSVRAAQEAPENHVSSRERPINLLLIGQDRLEGETRARSDSIILCTFRRDTHQLTITSFLRDLYVPIPGYGSNRINAAYTFGGMELLNRTLEENFDIEIDGTIEVDFSQFTQIIDVLGGVELELRQDEAELISQETGSCLSAGLQTLNGDQALSYARIRRLDSDGDFSRTQRQRAVLGKLLQNYRDASFITVTRVLNRILPMITTDMTTGEILSYALSLFPMLSDVTAATQRIPADGTYRDEVINDMCVLVANMDYAKKLLKSTISP